METVPEWIIRRNDSIYIGLLYELIGKTMNDKGLERIGKKRFYNPKSIRIDKGFEVYDALEIAISFIDGALYLNLLPTVHVRGKNGIKLDSETYKAQINRIVSSIYNRQYNENLRTWERMFLSSGKFVFENEGFILSFITPAISCGGIRRERHWLSFPSYMFPEPVMCYSDSDQSKRAINQLKGLCQYGPIDYSYSQKDTSRLTVRLAVFAPRQDMRKILEHLNNLNTTTANTGKDIFLPNYEGFERIYHRALLVPSENNKICIGYDREEQLKNSPQGFLDFMKRAINYYSRHTFDFDVLVIYIPRSFALFRTSEAISTDFNLHDALKLYATEHGVKIQIIEEKSIGSYYPCKVMWGLSTSLFAKASGVLWHPQAIQNDTAYIGISYAYSEEKGICIGCSQLFDSTGTGIRMVLRKIDNPLFRGKSNPYMCADDARAMMTELREQYYRSNPVNCLKRIVVHKTTPFQREETTGIMQALCGIDNVELIQIQEYCPWRGIKFGQVPAKNAEAFAVKRGMTVQLSDDSFLIWTHGCIIHPELSGKHYYKGSRGIPSPLLVKRYTGKANGDVLAQEILMLTKMNWNSGDSFYKSLPVTLDFAKVLARMSKQNEAIFDKAYDFRYFM